MAFQIHRALRDIFGEISQCGIRRERFFIGAWRSLHWPGITTSDLLLCIVSHTSAPRKRLTAYSLFFSLRMRILGCLCAALLTLICRRRRCLKPLEKWGLPKNRRRVVSGANPFGASPFLTSPTTLAPERHPTWNLPACHSFPRPFHRFKVPSRWLIGLWRGGTPDYCWPAPHFCHCACC